MLGGLGWDQAWQEAFAELQGELPQKGRPLVPARVTRQDRGWVTAIGDDTTYRATPSGRLKKTLEEQGTVLVTGDWVILEPLDEPGRARVHGLLPRRSRFARKAPGSGEGLAEQVVAANIDWAFLVAGLDGDYNLRRLERALALARDGGVRPVIVLNKVDLISDPEAKRSEVQVIAGEAPVYLVSAITGLGLPELHGYLGPGITVAMLGSSGAGKSTLVNALFGEARMVTNEVRAHDQRGKHTTTHRELLSLPSGGLIIDTPGMRELQLLPEEESLGDTFADVEEWARQCRFDDCRHETEPGCRVKAALEDGSLSDDRFQSFLKLRQEIAYEDAKRSPQLRAERKAKERTMTSAAWQASRNKRR
ncbi:MAG: ribosome small subunit-dependent GTPase A [Deltaproteobacteria bacterium]|jgi:ribosome biogenesis GTPase|nr:ribosome small subunit-dependent GTPase A [Deltaproteobacteria bacterium]